MKSHDAVAGVPLRPKIEADVDDESFFLDRTKN